MAFVDIDSTIIPNLYALAAIWRKMINMPMLENKNSQVVLIGLIVCLSLFGDLTLFAVLPTQYEHAGLAFAQVGIMLSIHRLVRIPGNPIVGVWMDRWGRKRFLVTGLVFATCATAGYGLVQGFWPFLMMRIFWGIAWMCINISGMALVIDLSNAHNRGRFAGLYNTWVMIGLAAGPLLGGFLVDRISFRATMLLGGGITLIALLLAIFMVPRKPAKHAGDGVARSVQVIYPSRQLLRNLPKEVWVIFILFAVILFTGEGVALSTISLRAQELFGSQVKLGNWQLGIAAIGGILLGYRSLAAAVASPIFGRISDGKMGRWGVLLLSLLAGSAGFVLLGVADGSPGLWFGLTFSAISAGSVMAVLVAWLGDLIPETQRGSIMGLYATFGDLGSMSGPLVAYQMMLHRSLQSVYILCAAVFLIGAMLIWFPRVFPKKVRI